MITLTLAETAALLGGELLGGPGSGDAAAARFTGLGTDSREPLTGKLFIALRGPNFDGHDYLDAARRQGASAALVERWGDGQPGSLPQIRVADTQRALGVLATAWRRRFNGKVVAVTGSNGKTTVKEMLAACLGQATARTRVLATAGNLNNAIGVPLTLARLADEDYAVIEMGANHPGEIAYLTRLARPHVALITNAGPAHLEGFGDLAGVARAKGEIYQGLVVEGVGVVNADDAFADYWRGVLRELGGNLSRAAIDFGIVKPAQLRAEIIAEDYDGSTLQLFSTGEGVTVRLLLPGRHAIYNALAAAAGAYAAGLSLAAIGVGLATVGPVGGRLQPLAGPYGSTLLDDTYNANPASLAAALQVLAAVPAAGRWLVLGDMAELGAETEALHRQAGAAAADAGVARLFAHGEHSRAAVAGFGAGGEHHATLETLVAAVEYALKMAQTAPTILVKGSRSARMERVVTRLCALK